MKLRVLSIAGIIFLLNACHVDRSFEETPEPEGRRVACRGTAYFIDSICEDEKEYLDWAEKAYPEYPRFSDLTRDVLRKITVETKDVDKAAALFYQRSLVDPRNRELVTFLNTKEKELQKRVPDYSSKKVLLALVPGMFWMDNPEIGAAGQQLRDLADQLGMRSTIVPTEQTGTVEQNAADICEFIGKQDDVNGIIVASISKGGSDMKKAVQLCGDKPEFRKVRGWFNIGGINSGSALVQGINDTFAYRMEARAYFCWKGYNWDGLLSMRAEVGAPLDFHLEVPKQMIVVNVVAVPLFRHVTARAKPYYQYLIQFGPNDGISLLADSMIPEGVTFISFRNDHYFRVPISEQKMQAFLVYILEKQFR